MSNSLLTDALKSKIRNLIIKQDYRSIINTLDSVKTAHAGTAKMKDKQFVIKEIVKHILQVNDPAKAFFTTGKKILIVKSDNAKEIGIHIIAKGYSYNKSEVTNWLYKIADDANWEVREYAAGAVVNVLRNNPEFYKTLKRWSKDNSENIRRVVVMSAVGLLDKENLNKAFDLLRPLLYDSSVYVKKNLGPFILGSYFGNKFPAETIKQLDKWIKIKDERVRWNIAMAFNCSFGNRYPGKALKYLEILIKDKSKVVNRAVISSLRSLNKRHPEIMRKFLIKNSISI